MLKSFHKAPFPTLHLEPSKLLFSRRGRDLLVILLLIVTGLAIYGQTLSYPFISFDDPGYVVHNEHVNQGLSWASWRWAWTSLERSNWHPLTWLSLMLDAQCYGLNAGGYHLTNLLLHLANSVLVFVWLRTATRAFWPCALTAFFFVAHPLHVESVAWVTERKDVLSTLFFCLTLLAYTRYAQTKLPRFYLAAIGLFALGLTAKPMLVTLPPLLLLLDYWPLRRFEKVNWWRLLVDKAPFSLLAVASCLVTVIAQRTQAMVPLTALPTGYRLASALLGYGSYLRKTLLPVGLGVYYPYWQSQSMWWPTIWLAVLVAATIGAFLGRRQLPFLLVGWLWFLGVLVPVIGVVQVGGQAVADRYAYLPHVGLFIAVFWTGAAIWHRSPAARSVLTTLTAIAAASCVALSYRQTGYWHSNLALFEHTASVVQPSARLYHLLGDAFVGEDQPKQAEAAYRRVGLNSLETMLPLGALLLKEERWQDAIDVLEPWRDRPEATAELLNNLAFALTRAGRGGEAAAVYRRCVTEFPNYALAHFGLAEILQARGDIVGAATQDEAGLSLDGDSLPALTRLSWDYAQSTDPQTQASALALAQHSVALSGGHDLASLNALAFAQAVNGQWNQAVATVGKALEIATRPDGSKLAVAGFRERLDLYRQKKLQP